MPVKHNNIKRLIHRTVEEIVSTLDIAKNTKLINFFIILKAKIINYKINKRGTPETEKETESLLRKHDIVLEYFEHTYSSFLKDYRFNECSIPRDSKFRNKIWICWWQGYNNAPELVKRCIDSIKKYSGSYEVILIDESNYKDFINMPEWLEKKKNNGIISRTHLSDYLRLSLLANHGGIWVDSTFLCTENCFERLLEPGIWSIKRPGCDHLSIAGGMFANFSFGCAFERRKVFAIIRDYLEQYWKNNSKMVDYLFLDYLIQLAIKHNSYVKESFEIIPENNMNCALLYPILDQPYNEKVWAELKMDTSLFKLSWKSSHKTLIDGKKTFYGKIIDKELEGE